MSVFSFVKAGKKAFDTIKSVKPFVPKNKKEILERDLRLARAKRKTSEVNLDNTVFRIEQQKEKLLGKQYKKGKELEKKATGGRVGRRFGSPKPKTNVQKIKETFAPKKKNLSSKQMKIAKLAGNPNKIDAADFKKLRNK